MGILVSKNYFRILAVSRNESAMQVGGAVGITIGKKWEEGAVYTPNSKSHSVMKRSV